jgi:hypothetical protein
MGYPIKRKRQMCILVLKRWIDPQLRAAGMSTSCNPVDVQHLVNLQATLDALSSRPCHLSWKDFIVATPEEQHAEIREAARRPGVVRRWASAAEGHTTTTDKTGKTCRVFAGDRGCPVLEALLPMQRERIESVLWQEHPGADVVVVSQNPSKRARTIKRGETTFMTVIAGCGYFVRTDIMRERLHASTLVAAADVLSMSGFPISDEQVSSAGTHCMFSRCRSASAPASRSAKSMKKQVGNAMHFTHVGLILLSALLKFPKLGAVTPPSPTTKVSTSSPTPKRTSDTSASGGESSFLRAVRARRSRR